MDASQMFIAFGLGTVLSFVGAIPVAGPISALVFRKVLLKTSNSARWIAFGAALAEALYAGLAAFGVETAFNVWPEFKTASNWLTVGILVSLGIYFLKFNPQNDPKVTTPETAPHLTAPGAKKTSSFWTGFSISAVNLTLLATWSAAWTLIKSKSWIEGYSAAMTSSWITLGIPLAFAAGVWLGISTWFSLAITWAQRAQNSLQPHIIRRVMQGIGLALLLTGLRWIWVFR